MTETREQYKRMTVDELKVEFLERGYPKPDRDWHKPKLIEWLVADDARQEQAVRDAQTLAASMGTFKPEPALSDEEKARYYAATGDLPYDDSDDDASGALVPIGEVPRPSIPEPAVWDQLTAMARYFCTSQLVPKAIRTSRTAEADCALVLLGARDLGITPTEALSKLHVIEGRLTMSAELMVALVLRAGHRIWPDPANDDQHAVAYGQRKGDTTVVTVSFTMADARAAGVTNKDVWKRYPADMLWARAVSRLCRRVFPDCLSGVSYVPEELGAITVEGEDTEPPPAPRLSEEEQAHALGFNNMDAAHRATDAVRKSVKELNPDQRGRYETWRQAAHLAWPYDAQTLARIAAKVVEIAHDEDVEDAELVPEPGGSEVVTGRTANETLGIPLPLEDDRWSQSDYGRAEWALHGVTDVDVALANEADGYAPGDPEAPM